MIINVNNWLKDRLPRHNSDDIAIDHSNTFAECYWRDSTGSVTTDTGKCFLQQLRSWRNDTVQFIHNLAGWFVQTSSAGIISEAGPKGVDLLQGGAGQGRNIGPFIDPFRVVRFNGGNLSLLEHDFGNQHYVLVKKTILFINYSNGLIEWLPE